MRQKLILTVCFLFGFCSLASCSGQKTQTEGYFSADGVYLGFEDLPEYSTAEAALGDGCFVVISEDDEPGSLYGGSEHWAKFLKDSEKGEDAFLRVVHFIDGTAYACDLLYVEGAYYYFDAEYEDLSGRPYRYLRKLSGLAGNPEKESVFYVLTDSLELTFDEVERYFFTSSMEVMETTPDFRWLGFTVYLD